MPDTTYVTLRDTNDQPFDEREIADTGQIVKSGTAVEVPTAVAGKAPKGKPGEEDWDPGEGLLAQVDVWRAANKSETDAAKKRAEPDETAAPAATTTEGEK